MVFMVEALFTYPVSVEEAEDPILVPFSLVQAWATELVVSLAVLQVVSKASDLVFLSPFCPPRLIYANETIKNSPIKRKATAPM